jgi:drug/metabolite transporter (DMT)-like permease
MTTPSSHHLAKRWQIVTAFVAIYVLWGSTYFGIRLAVESIPPFFMAGTRAVIAGALLYVLARWRGAARPERFHWRATTIAGGFLLLGGNGLVSWAEQRVPSGISALVVGSTPLWMVLLEWLWHSGPRPTVGIVSGLVIGFVGLGILVGPGKLGNGGHIDPVGAGALLLAAFLWATGSLYSRKAKLPPSQWLASAMEMICGGLLLLLAGAATGEWSHFNLMGISRHSMIAWIYLTLFGSLVGFTAYVWLLNTTTPARVSTYAYVNPVVAVLLGWAFLNEPITGRTLTAAAAIILAVVVIVTRSAEAPAEV